MSDEAIQRGIENVYCHASMLAQQNEDIRCSREAMMVEPFCVYGAQVFKDGDKWCALLGKDINKNVKGYGASPAEAVAAFNKAWYEKLALDPVVEVREETFACGCVTCNCPEGAEDHNCNARNCSSPFCEMVEKVSSPPIF